jgi:hypothetical protein
MIADQLTKGMFNAPLREFLTSTTGGTGYGTGFSATQITLREILSGATGGDYGTQYTTTIGGKKGTYGNKFGDQVVANLKENGLMMAFNLIAIPVAFRVGKRVLAKSLINPVNRQIRMVGIRELKV